MHFVSSTVAIVFALSCTLYAKDESSPKLQTFFFMLFFIYIFWSKLSFNTPNNINPTNSTKTDNNKNNALINPKNIISIFSLRPGVHSAAIASQAEERAW